MYAALESDAIAAIAMAASDHVDTAQKSLERLKMLAWRPGAEEVLPALGTLAAVVGAMARHPTSPGIQEAGAGTISLLCLDELENAKAAVAAGALPVLVAAVGNSLAYSAGHHARFNVSDRSAVHPEVTLVFTEVYARGPLVHMTAVMSSDLGRLGAHLSQALSCRTRALFPRALFP